MDKRQVFLAFSPRYKTTEFGAPLLPTSFTEEEEEKEEQEKTKKKSMQLSRWRPLIRFRQLCVCLC